MPRQKKRSPIRLSPIDYGLILLTIIALGLAVLIIKPVNPAKVLQTLTALQKPPVQKKMSPRTALTPPPRNASQEQNKEFFNAVAKAAQEAPYLETANCDGKPGVIKVKNHTALLVKNSGTTARHITFLTKNYTINPKTEEQIPIDIERVPGIYGLGCDLLKDRAMGLVFIPAQ